MTRPHPHPAPASPHARADETFADGPEPPLADLIVDAAFTLMQLVTPSADSARLRGASDDELLQLAGIVAHQAQAVHAQQALIAGEIATRSRPELGLTGLAASRGHRTPAELVRVTTGSTLRDARTTVEVGTLLVETAQLPEPATGELPVPTAPWMATIAERVAAGGFAPEKAAAIRRGLGTPSAGIGVDALTAAAGSLLDEGALLDVDRVHARARELRDELDVAGVAEREVRRREQRSFRLHRQSDGMTRAVWMMDPETAAIVTDVVDRATSPKLGGPRFVRDDEVERALRIERDPRTAEQYASDVLVELLRLGHTADPQLLGGDEPPAVRVLVTRTDLDAHRRNGGSGVAFIEGQSAPVSTATAERHLCSDGFQELGFDAHGRGLDLGRTRRLFSRRQRRALAARDGGCMFPGCERPPSWTEAHHIRHWGRDRGGTDLDDGILLCRHHHRLVHNQGWEFRHLVGDGVQRYELIPPPSTDPLQRPIVLPSRSAAYRRLLASPRGDGRGDHRTVTTHAATTRATSARTATTG